MVFAHSKTLTSMHSKREALMQEVLVKVLERDLK